ncbi:MAG: hypothetical protein R3A79_12885 [Nannocystaceae bacterium]
MLRRILPLALAVAALGLTSTADARAPHDGGDRPWKRGILMPSVGLGAGFSSTLTQVQIGLGASYFVANGLAFGLNVSDTIFIFSQDFRATYPGIEDQVATNMLRVMPTARWVFWRNRWFSPYVFGGAGPVFLNHGGGTVGEWNAGPGAYIGLGGPVFLDLGVGFSARFPREKCDEAFYYNGPDAAGQVIDACSFRWGPRIGLVLAFGGGRSSRRARRRPAPPPEPAPAQTWEEEQQPPPPTWVEPEPPAEPTPPPEPAPVEPAPEPVPEDSGAAIEGAAEPSDAADPASEPATETQPVAPPSRG